MRPSRLAQPSPASCPLLSFSRDSSEAISGTQIARRKSPLDPHSEIGVAMVLYVYHCKIGSDVHATKKFGDISISSRFFILTYTSFRPPGVKT